MGRVEVILARVWERGTYNIPLVRRSHDVEHALTGLASRNSLRARSSSGTCADNPQRRGRATYSLLRLTSRRARAEAARAPSCLAACCSPLLSREGR